MRFSEVHLGLLRVSAVVLVSACSSGYGDSPVSTPRPTTTVTFTVFRDTLFGGEAATVSVRAKGASGQELFGRVPTLTSSNPAVALIDAHGRIRAVSAGEAAITATVDGGSATKRVVVSGADAAFALTRYEGKPLPSVISVDSTLVNGAVQVREIHVDSGALRLTGAPRPAYSTEVLYGEYDVTAGPGGERLLTLRHTLTERDQGILLYNAEGDYLMVSAIDLTRTHVGQPDSTGVLLRYALPGVRATASIDFAR
jgi:Bacterial Ig-like domain (group 2)